MGTFSSLKLAISTSNNSNKGEIKRQFIFFVINGGFLGIIAWGSQLLIYTAIGTNAFSYALASTITYPPLIILNFLIQKKYIFSRPGCFKRFVIANLLIMALVSLLSIALRALIGEISTPAWGDRLGFIFAALIGAIPSFTLKRLWVFRK